MDRPRWGSLGINADDNFESTNRPYHAKRPHKKSRAGCSQCKRRKVKCDEGRPTCRACRLRKETCVYPGTAVTPSSPSTPNSSSPGRSPGLSPSSDAGTVVAEPLFRPRQLVDALDMKMLWFYTTWGFHYFSIQTGRSAAVDHVLQVKVVEHAFRSPFLMDCLMAVSSLHLRSMNQPIQAHRTANYCARAFEGYRNAIEAANPADYPALIACSLLIVVVSSQAFRDPEGKSLYIIDWMQVWRGIGLIFEIVSPAALQESGMAVLFYRPPVDLEKATGYIPNNLLFMIASIRPGDADYGHEQTYYDMLKYLGSLYQEMREHGFNPILDLRVITFFTFIPKSFIPLAKEHRPRALVILAYYLCFTKLIREVWWMRDISDDQISQVCREIGDEWSHLLRVPQSVLKMTDKVEIAQTIINNRNWSPGELDLYEKNRDPRLDTDLKLVNNSGSEVRAYRNQWRRKASVESIERGDVGFDMSSLGQSAEFSPDVAKPVSGPS
ncbi:hypothetical protein GGS23DRAFT_608276 [Durotheca rogersii]|uniref:uncharacterized protein n=1 Tax=Durotheca rogersii TaxID=419775 RepID=UPI00221FD990|nr:uncharacterized protein GGS23DRAFT_608276 [Durotheca rogersii]KAI5854534.1 hypothetical protein GGS23DRAFT_608276 [Durotheca rogersii]